MKDYIAAAVIGLAAASMIFVAAKTGSVWHFIGGLLLCSTASAIVIWDQRKQP